MYHDGFFLVTLSKRMVRLFLGGSAIDVNATKFKKTEYNSYFTKRKWFLLLRIILPFGSSFTDLMMLPR